MSTLTGIPKKIKNLFRPNSFLHQSLSIFAHFHNLTKLHLWVIFKLEEVKDREDKSMRVLNNPPNRPGNMSSCALRTEHQALCTLFKELHFSCQVFASESNFKNKISFLFVSFVQFVAKTLSLSPARTKTEPKLNRKNILSRTEH
jgi:hypothetical protein